MRTYVFFGINLLDLFVNCNFEFTIWRNKIKTGLSEKENSHGFFISIVLIMLCILPCRGIIHIELFVLYVDIYKYDFFFFSFCMYTLINVFTYKFCLLKCKFILNYWMRNLKWSLFISYKFWSICLLYLISKVVSCKVQIINHWMRN